MRGFHQYISSTIGSKQIMAIAGLGLCGFLFVHMAGNLLLLVGPESYNIYSHKLVTNPLIYVAEVGLVFLFLAHVVKATIVSVRNRQARGASYTKFTSGEKHTTPVSRTLMAQGLVILVFVILHLATFKYGAYYTATYKGEEVRDLNRLVLEVFRQPGYVIWYTVALLVLSLHLGHGFYSCFQTLGFNHPKYSPLIKGVGIVYNVVVSGGFLILPFYAYFRG